MILCWNFLGFFQRICSLVVAASLRVSCEVCMVQSEVMQYGDCGGLFDVLELC